MDTEVKPEGNGPETVQPRDFERESYSGREMRPAPHMPPGGAHQQGGAPVAAWVLIGLGVFTLLMNFGWWFSRLWPLALVAIGLVILLRRR